MANPEHLEILKQGVEAWNKWRQQNPNTTPDLRNAQLEQMNLQGVNLDNALLGGACLKNADLQKATMRHAILREADLFRADLSGADLSEASLGRAKLVDTNLTGAILSSAMLDGTVLQGAQLSRVTLTDATLLGADLSHARLSKATLRQANLRDADLNHASLHTADLRRACLEGAILKGANLRNADLREADLRRADLTEAELDDALLRDASLRHARLKEVIGLNANQLGATDVTGASLPQDIQDFDHALDRATHASNSAHRLFITLMIACLYCLITIGTTTDALLLDNSASANLPIIQAPVPYTLFYIVGPILLLCLYVYLHLDLQRLWEALAALPAVLPDGRQLFDRVSPWLLGELIFGYFPRLKDHGRRFILLQRYLSLFLAWLATPSIAMLFWLRYLPKHDWTGTSIHVMLLAFLVTFSYLFYDAMAETLRGVRAKRGGARVLEVLLPCVGFLSVTFLICFHWSYKLIEGAHPCPAVLSGAELSKKPPNWDPVDPNQTGVKRAKLAHADLRCAIADAAFLARADLLGADMRDAHLWYADLRKAFLVGANLRRAILFEADLRGARLDGADLVLAQLGDAQLGRAQLPYANLSGALLDGANLRGANLFRARLDGAQMSHYTYIRFGPTGEVLEVGTDLAEAILNKASLRGADLRDANLTGASLSEANLTGANLSGANLSKANLCKANLSGANLSGVHVTDTTDFNDVRVDPNTSFDRVELTNKHRQQIWGPNGVPESPPGSP
jgi:uncharacterized protein YjbI with pentapeptide repeats